MRAHATRQMGFIGLLGLGGCCLEIVTGNAGFDSGGRSSSTATGTPVVTSSGSSGTGVSSGGWDSSGNSGASTGSGTSSGTTSSGSTTGPMGCTIDGQSYAARAFNPSNAAECCNPRLSRSAWQPLFVKTLSFPVASGNGQIDGALGDLNGDGLADMVLITHTEQYATDNAQVWVYLSKGGSYTGPFTYDTGQLQGSGVTLGDLNGDGLPDVIVTTSEAVNVFLNLGGGKLGFESPHYLPHDWCGNVGPPRLIDASSRGWLDVAVAIQNCGRYVYKNDATGHGGLLAPVEIVGDPSFGNPSRNLLTVGHFNGDAYQDLTCSVGTSLGWFVQTRNGFGYAVTFAEPRGDWIDLATVSTGQGDAVVATNGSAVNVLPPTNNGPGVAASYPVDEGGGTLAVADVNGDGDPDLLVASIDPADAGSSTVDVLLNQGGALFGQSGSLPVPGAESDSISRVGAGDLNGDGAADMALIWSNGPWEVWINNCGPEVK